MVITIGKVNDVTFYRNMLSCGVQEYLVKPVSTEQMREAFLSAEHTLRTPAENTLNEEDQDKEKIISFIGVRGGVGASTLATNCAWILAMKKNKKRR